MERLWQDVRYGFRMLWKSPTFTLIAIITLALGIGANTAIFSIIYGIVLKPLPYKDPDKLVHIQSYNPSENFPPLIITVPARYVGWRERNHVFENLAGRRESNFNLTIGEKAERVLGDQITYNYFDTLGINPIKGRFFFADEDKPGNAQVVILKESYWQERFAGDPNIIGKTLVIDNKIYTIIGIAPSDFRNNFSLYIPLALELDKEVRGLHSLQVIGRLKAGVSISQAEAEMKAIAEGQVQEDPNVNSGWTVALSPMHELIVKKVRPTLMILLAAVCLVLLIACANVANLILVRATIREKEVVIRAALGAGRLRLAQQFFTESVLLALIGGTLGIILANLIITIFVKWKLILLPRTTDIAINLPVLCFTLVVSMLVGVSLGLVPIIQASKVNLTEIMKETGNTLTGWRTRRISNILVVGEVALSLVLLIGAGLLIRSFLKIQQVDPGFNPKNVLTTQLVLQGVNYEKEDQCLNFEKDVIQKISALPGVEAVSITTAIPLSGKYPKIRFTVEGKTVDFAQIPFGPSAEVTPDYFKVMGIPLLKGRFFTEQDQGNSPKIAIINQKMAEDFFPGQDPIGKRITRGAPDTNETPEWSEIVGVVGNVKVTELKDDGDVQIYYPAYQYPGDNISRNVFLAIRTKVEPTTLTASTRETIQKIDKELPIFNIRTLQQIVSDSLTYSRFLIMLLGLFAAVALLLAIVGIYGVISYSVAQRTHEIGIRLALGAQNLDIMKMVLKEGMTLALLGIGIGFLSALGFNHLIKSLLYEVTVTDPVTYLVIVSTLFLVALLAIYIPASRATSVDPMVALRRE